MVPIIQNIPTNHPTQLESKVLSQQIKTQTLESWVRKRPVGLKKGGVDEQFDSVVQNWNILNACARLMKLGGGERKGMRGCKG